MAFKKILFRCDAGSHIGGGHMIRCLAFADELSDAGYQCYFLCNEQAWYFPALINSGYPKVTESGLKQHDFIYGIIDHYDLDEAYEKTLRPFCEKLLVIDDLANRKHDCDILVDFSPSRKESDYAGLVPQDCRIFTGIKYLIMRKDFFSHNKVLNKPSKLNCIFVAMGSIDGTKKLPTILQYLEKYKECLDVNILLTHKTKTIEQVKNLAASSHHNILLHIDIANPVNVMLQSDLALSAGGMTCLELIMLQIPTLAIVVADNQIENVNYLSANKYIKHIKDLSELEQLDLSKLFHDEEFKKFKTGKGIKIIDEMF